MFYRKTFGICFVGLMMCAACSAELPSESIEKPVGNPGSIVTNGDDAIHQSDESTPETVVIPLNQIWVRNMPGKRQVNFLSGIQLPQPIGSLSSGPLDTLEHLGKEKAGPGFAVLGKGQDALVEAHKKLPEGEQPSTTLPYGTDISVVYFSHKITPIDFARGYVRRTVLRRVERIGNTIEVQYRLDGTGSSAFSERFALIPLGKLPVGEYHVNVIEAPTEKDSDYPQDLAKMLHRTVCDSFTFSVVCTNNTTSEPVSPVEIPLDQIWASDMPGTRDIRSLDLEHLPQPFRMISTGSISSLHRFGKERAEAGFVVRGIGQDALVAAHKKLPNGEKPPGAVPSGTDISIVYFSYSFGSYIRLHRVERCCNTIDIRYRYDASGTEGASNHLALIPLGKLSVGECHVNMIETPPEKGMVHSADVAKLLHRTVCQSFSFFVIDCCTEQEQSVR